MKKAFLLIIYHFFLLWFCSCEKNDPIRKSYSNSLLDSSQIFFNEDVIKTGTMHDAGSNFSFKPNENPAKFLTRTPMWNDARLISISKGPAVIIPIHYNTPFLVRTTFSRKNLYSADGLTKLLIYKDGNNKFYAEVLTFFPDSNYSWNIAMRFTGIVTVERWNGEPINKYKFEKDGKIRKCEFDALKMKQPGSRTIDLHTEEMQIVQVCYQSYGYNYMADDFDDGGYWTQDLGCDMYFVDDSQGGGGSGGGTTGGDYGIIGGDGNFNTSNSFTLLSGNTPITNINEYNQCFTNTPGNNNSYSITLCVSQPEAGSRDSWGFDGGNSSATGNPVSVGHTFLIFNETNSLGSTIRNLGFYPSTNTSPLSPISQGQLNNDANHDYNLAVNITVNSSQFFQVLNFTSQGNDKGFLYNLNTNNCTTFALNALATGGINFPRTSGTWLNGSGLNPGDLGEDIRQMQLQPNMTRTDLTGTHPNVGFCYY